MPLNSSVRHRNKMNVNLRELAIAWAASQEAHDERTQSEWASIFAVHDLLSNPENLWQFIIIAEPLCTGERAFGMLGTGPLEDLIQEYGVAFIDRMEQHASKSHRFAQLFKHVWVLSDSDPITTRYLALGCAAVGPRA